MCEEIEKNITLVRSMEHYDQNESNGNAATKYIIEFTGKVNCEWLWSALNKALVSEEKVMQDFLEDKPCKSCDAVGSLKLTGIATLNSLALRAKAVHDEFTVLIKRNCYTCRHSTTSLIRIDGFGSVPCRACGAYYDSWEYKGIEQ